VPFQRPLDIAADFLKIVMSMVGPDNPGMVLYSSRFRFRQHYNP
jgi:hypothetical protein